MIGEPKEPISSFQPAHEILIESLKQQLTAGTDIDRPQMQATTLFLLNVAAGSDPGELQPVGDYLESLLVEMDLPDMQRGEAEVYKEFVDSAQDPQALKATESDELTPADKIVLAVQDTGQAVALETMALELHGSYLGVMYEDSLREGRAAALFHLAHFGAKRTSQLSILRLFAPEWFPILSELRQAELNLGDSNGRPAAKEIAEAQKLDEAVVRRVLGALHQLNFVASLHVTHEADGRDVHAARITAGGIALMGLVDRSPKTREKLGVTEAALENLHKPK